MTDIENKIKKILIKMFMVLINSSFPNTHDVKKHLEFHLKFREMIIDMLDKNIVYSWYLICKSFHELSNNFENQTINQLVNWYQVHIDALMMNGNDAYIYIGNHGQCCIIFDRCRSMPENINDTPEVPMDLFEIDELYNSHSLSLPFFNS